MVKEYTRSELSGTMLDRVQRKLDQEYEKQLEKWKAGRPMPVRVMSRRTKKPRVVKRAKRVKKK